MRHDRTPVIRRASVGPSETVEELEPLPADIVRLLVDLDAPPRLAAHLRAVHHVAVKITEAISETFPTLAFDAAIVAFGAATHDIGKVLHPDELTGPGSAHERDGERLLRDHGVQAESARFARTHAAWHSTIPIEDLLVSLADKVWKGRREPDLEQLVVERVTTSSGDEPWEVYLRLDEILVAISDGADERLSFQSQFEIN